MKRSLVRTRTAWSVAIALPFGRPASPQFTSAELLGTATALAGAIITNTYICIDQAGTNAKHRAGRQVW
jgi:hypothetical protein